MSPYAAQDFTDVMKDLAVQRHLPLSRQIQLSHGSLSAGGRRSLYRCVEEEEAQWPQRQSWSEAGTSQGPGGRLPAHQGLVGRPDGPPHFGAVTVPPGLPPLRRPDELQPPAPTSPHLLEFIRTKSAQRPSGRFCCYHDRGLSWSFLTLPRPRQHSARSPTAL